MCLHSVLHKHSRCTAAMRQDIATSNGAHRASSTSAMADSTASLLAPFLRLMSAAVMLPMCATVSMRCLRARLLFSGLPVHCGTIMTYFRESNYTEGAVLHPTLCPSSCQTPPRCPQHAVMRCKPPSISHSVASP